MDGQVKQGYKQTEVGLIPEDWECSKFKNFYSESSRNGLYKSAEFQGYGTRIVNMGEMFGFEFISNQEMSRIYVTEREKNINGLKDGDLLFGRRSVVPSGAGKCSIVINPDDAIVFESSIIRVRTKKEICSLFLYYLFSSQVGNHIISPIVSGTNIKGIRASDLQELNLPIPPIAEQEKIAEALSDVDSLIESLEELIAKKRHIKKGAMQKLLIPKDNWIEKRLGDTATLKARIGWQGLTTSEYLKSGEYYLVTGTEFKNGFIGWDNCFYVDELRYKQDKNIQLKEHDVLVTKDGTIGKVALITSLNKPATLNSGVFVIRPINESFYPDFLYYLLCSNLFTDFLNQLTAGSTISHLYQKDFVNFIYYTPPTKAEQEAIAEVLTDMDHEITVLEEKLNKTRQIKQGMMQELLTGRIRLI